MENLVLKNLMAKSSLFSSQPEVLSYFGLEGNPFYNSNGSCHYFMTAEYQKYATDICNLSAQGSRLLIVEGVDGIGKTSFSKYLTTVLKQADMYVLSESLNRKLTGVNATPSNGSWLYHEIERFKNEEHLQGNNQLVLFIDDADNFSLSQLDVLSTMLGQKAETSLASVVLFCSPKFVEELVHSSTWVASGLVGRCFTLHTFRYNETVKFIEYRLSKAGQLFITSLFDQPALKLIHELSKGVPQRILDVTKAFMLLAYEKRYRRIDHQLINETFYKGEKTKKVNAELSTRPSNKYDVTITRYEYRSGRRKKNGAARSLLKPPPELVDLVESIKSYGSQLEDNGYEQVTTTKDFDQFDLEESIPEINIESESASPEQQSEDQDYGENYSSFVEPLNQAAATWELIKHLPMKDDSTLATAERKDIDSNCQVISSDQAGTDEDGAQDVKAQFENIAETVAVNETTEEAEQSSSYDTDITKCDLEPENPQESAYFKKNDLNVDTDSINVPEAQADGNAMNVNMAMTEDVCTISQVELDRLIEEYEARHSGYSSVKIKHKSRTATITGAWPELSKDKDWKRGRGKQKGCTIAIDMGTSYVKAAILGKSGTVIKLAQEKIAYQSGRNFGYGNPNDEDVLALTTTIHQLVHKLGIQGAEVIVTSSGKGFAIRSMRMPKMPFRELEKAIRFELENDQLPFEVNDAILRLRILEQENEDSRINILSISALQKVIASLTQATYDAGLVPVAVEPGWLSIQRYLSMTNLIPPERTVAVIDVGGNITEITICKNQELKAVRTFAIGGQTFTKTISDTLMMDNAAAEQYKREYGSAIPPENRNINASLSSGDLHQALQPILETWLDEIKRFLDFNRGEDINTHIDSLVLIGGSTTLTNLDVFLSTRLDMPVATVDAPSGLFPKRSKSQRNISSFVNALGAALWKTEGKRAINLLDSHLVRKPGKRSKKSKSIKINSAPSQYKLPAVSQPQKRMLVGTLVLCLVAVYVGLSLKLQQAKNTLIMVEESFAQCQAIVAQIDSVAQLKNKTLKDINTIASIKDSVLSLSDSFSNLPKGIPEGVSLSEIEYSKYQFKVRGWTKSSKKIRPITNWLNEVGFAEPELSFAKQNSDGEIDFEVLGLLPSFYKNTMEQGELAQNQ